MTDDQRDRALAFAERHGAGPVHDYAVKYGIGDEVCLVAEMLLEEIAAREKEREVMRTLILAEIDGRDRAEARIRELEAS